MIPFNLPIYTEQGIQYIEDAIIKNRRLNGDGIFTKKCTEWFMNRIHADALLTTSCTHALEMTALLADIKPGDEVIMPSFTFVSTADAFVMRGAKIVFVDIRKDTMNIDENLIENAITDKTKAIVPVHYAGVGCEMDTIMEIAGKYNLLVVEDAAQGMMSSYKGKPLGTIGDFGTYSFHETKNYTMGEGGLVIINDNQYYLSAEILREKGTNRTQFFRGEVDKYSWVECGSSYLPSEMNAAYLYAQLEIADEINDSRLNLWNRYYEGLSDLREKIELPFVPDYCEHNAHMFYIKCRNLEERTHFIEYMLEHGVKTVFHYVPLHTSKAGMKYGVFAGEDRYTTAESDKLVRMPIYYGLKEEEVDYIIDEIHQFYKNR